MATQVAEQPDILTFGICVGVGILTIYALYKNYFEAPSIGLTGTEYKEFKLIKKDRVSHNTRKFRFALQSDTTTLGLPIGRHISLRFFDQTQKDEDGNDDEIRRPYTPVTSNDNKGYFDLVIKIYPGGRMSQHLDSLNIGQSIQCRGPLGKVHYYDVGSFNIKLGSTINNIKCKHIGMIAGGTGITPMLQIIRHIHKTNNDDTQMSLIFGNVSIDDVLLRDELNRIDKTCDNFKLYYTLDKAPEDWTQGVGYVTQDMINQNLPQPSEDTVMLLCGPTIMVNICAKTLVKMGHDAQRVIKY